MKFLDALLRRRLFKVSLRTKVVLIFILPLISVLAASFYVRDVREQRALEDQIETSTIQLGDMAVSGLKHAMLRNDQQAVARIINNIGSTQSIERIWLVNLGYRIIQSTNPSDVGEVVRTDQAGCIECHRYALPNRPRITPMRIGEDILRVVSPIPNDPECQACHSASDAHLGILIIDAPLGSIREHMRESDLYNAGLSLLSIVLVGGLAYMLIQWLVVQRVEVLYKSLSAFAAGDFSVRVPKRWRTEDEITRLADHFNEIAEALQRHEKEQQEIAIVRQEAIAEERERIARELHDGVAQLLAYLSTKLSAVRLLLSKKNAAAADEQLSQMEEAIKKQATEVRAAIIGLRLVGQSGNGLVRNLEDYVMMCNRLSNLRTVLEVNLGQGDVHIAPETELHLLRIVQEAISNIRKHASASEARVRIGLEDGDLMLEIRDNGVGFNPWESGLWKAPHFGLRTMAERAEKINATLNLDSAPGVGTLISVRVKLQET